MEYDPVSPRQPVIRYCMDMGIHPTVVYYTADHLSVSGLGS